MAFDSDVGRVVRIEQMGTTSLWGFHMNVPGMFIRGPGEGKSKRVKLEEVATF